jgi:hypothetical protein
MNSRLQNQLYIIEKERNVFLKILSQVEQSRIQREPADGKWSPGQVLCHLVMTEEASLRYIKKKINAGDSIPSVKLMSDVRMFILRKAFDGKRKFKAPEAFETPENLTLEEVRMRWDKVRKELFMFSENYPERYIKKAIFKHPVAGRISLIQMMVFFKIHMHHHRKQVEKMIQ